MKDCKVDLYKKGKKKPCGEISLYTLAKSVLEDIFDDALFGDDFPHYIAEDRCAYFDNHVDSNGAWLCLRLIRDFLEVYKMKVAVNGHRLTIEPFIVKYALRGEVSYDGKFHFYFNDKFLNEVGDMMPCICDIAQEDFAKWLAEGKAVQRKELE